ncbi:hypothetical protein Tco_0716143 [Tanacetum coccineum]
MGDANPIRTLRDYTKPSHEGYRNTNELPVGNNVVPLRSDTIQKDCKTPQRYPNVPTTSRRFSLRSMDSGKLRDRNAKESWALLEDLTLYDNESWNDPRDFAKPFKTISLPQDFPSTSDRSLIELENQVQRLMEAHLALMQPTQEDEAKEEGNVKTSTTEYEDHEMTVESEEEFEEETEEEIKEEEEDSPKHFDTFPTMKELKSKPSAYKEFAPLDNSKATVLKH